MSNPVDYGTPDVAPQQPLVDLGGPEDQGPSEDVAQARAQRAAFALPQLPQTYDNYLNDITSGRELQSRQQASSQLDALQANQFRDWLSQPGLKTVGDALKYNKTSSPDSVFEQNYASEFMNYFYKSDQQDGDFADAVKTVPAYLKATLDAGSDIVSRQQFIQNGLENAQEAYKNQSYLGFGVNVAEGLIQTYNEAKLRGNVSGVSAFDGLLGTNLEAQRKRLMNMPWNQFKQEYSKVMQNLISTNPTLAIVFANAMKGQSEEEIAGSNVMTALMGLEGATAAQALYGVSKTGAQMAQIAVVQRQARKMVQQAAAQNGAPVSTSIPLSVRVPTATGNLRQAGIAQTANQATQVFEGTADPTSQALNALTSNLRVTQTAVEANAGNYGTEIMNRVSEQFNNALTNMVSAILETARVQRIGTVLASDTVVRTVEQEVRSKYPGLAGNVINMMPIRFEPVTNTFSIDTILARNDGTYFTSVREANKFARDNDIYVSHIEGARVINKLQRGATGQFTGQVTPISPTVRGAAIHQNANGYYLAVNRPITETDHAIRDALMQTAKSQDVNKGWFNSLGLGWIRTPEDTLSLQDRINRKLSVYGPAMMKAVLEENGVPINIAKSSLRGKSIPEVWQNLGKGSQFQRMLDATDKMVVDGKQGYNFKNPAELEYFYRQNFARSPDAIEVEAYFAKVRGQDMDLAFRDMAEFKNRHRLGAEQHVVSKVDAKTNKNLESPEFAGMSLKGMPGGQNARIVVIGEDGTDTTHWINALSLSKKGREIDDGVQNGTWKIVKIYNSDQNPFETFAPSSAGKRIQYVASKDIQTRSLNFNQIPRREGGHLQYDYDWYIKQARVVHDDGTHTYIGDATLMPIDNRLMGSDLVKNLEEVRAYLARGDVAGAMAANKTSIPWDKLYERFNYTYRNGVKTAPQLDVFEPFYVVPKNKTIMDMENHFKGQYGDNFIDGTKSGNPARQFQVQFTGERDAFDVMTVTNEGTRGNPLFSYQPAKTIDPLTSINRALNNIVNSTFMDDMKISSMEHWLQKHMDKLDATPSEIASAPFYHFANTSIKKAVDRSAYSAAEAERYQIRQFTGIPSKVEGVLDSWEYKLADAIYGGNSKLERGLYTLGRYALATTRNAPAFLRSVAFKADIGLFSLPQLLVQSNTYVTILGIAGPVRAAQGTVGALLHQYSRINSSPEILASLDRIATKFGWKPGEWLEARDHLNASGFSYVGKETNAFMSDFGDHSVITTPWGNFLNAGDMFFKAGERHSRFGAWYTAWKEKNFTTSASLADRADVLERADLYGGNMTSASKSMLQSGAFAFPAQFMGYVMRLSEQFLGKRLTTVEKMRLLGTYATVYGVPVAAGVATLPLGSTMQQAALKAGYIPHENALSTTLMEGVPEALIHYATGNSYNIAERFGSPGLELWNEVFKGDKPWWNIVTGASGSLVDNTLGAMSPMYKTLISLARDENPFKMTSSDLIQPLKEIASVNAASRLQAALHAQVWQTKNETPLVRDVSPLNAVIMTLTGLSPLGASRDQIYREALDKQEDTEKWALQNFTRDFRRGLQSLRDNDTEQAQAYFKNADATLAIAHYPITKRAAAIAIATEGQTLPERLRWQYFMKDVPSDEEISRQQQFGAATRQGL